MKPKLLTIGALALLLLLALGTLSRHLRTEEPMSGLAVDRLMQLPVLEGGRVKPLDTVARNALLVINRKQHYVSEEDKKVLPPIGSLNSCSISRVHRKERSSGSIIRKSLACSDFTMKNRSFSP